MSEQQYTHYVERELERLNQVIDHNIIHGYGYKRESHLHKALLRKSQSLKRKKLFNKMKRMFSFFF